LADEDFELVRRAWAAFNRRDQDAIGDFLHPDVVAIPFGAALEGKAYRGRDEVMGWWNDEILVTWGHFQVHPERFERVGDRLLVTGHWTARGFESGVDLDIPASWVIEVRDGQIAYWQTHTDGEQARREVGLEEAR
jgi:ketosteroid isomerase-like protein